MQNETNNQSESATRVLVPNNPIYRRSIKRTVEAVKRLRNMNRIPKGVSGKFNPKFTPTIQTLHYLAKELPFTGNERRQSSEPTEGTQS